MSIEYEQLAKELMNGKDTEGLESLKSLLSTSENRRILASALGDGNSLKRAFESAKSGDTSAAREIIGNITKAPGGNELIAKVLRAIEDKK